MDVTKLDWFAGMALANPNIRSEQQAYDKAEKMIKEGKKRQTKIQRKRTINEVHEQNRNIKSNSGSTVNG